MSSLTGEPELRRQFLQAMGAPRWWLGLSGGLDSVVLLHLLHHWRRQHPRTPPLHVVHVHHGLQPAADRWREHCQTLCESLSLPLHCHEVRVRATGKGPEQAAREARYELFESLLGAGDVLFLAHHRNDQVETVFLRLLRGAGLEGLGAMPRSRALGRGRLQRPLLHLPRAQLLAWACSEGLEWVDDPSNADTALDRNFLRHEILPRLAERWPGMDATVARSASHLAEAAAQLEAAQPPPQTCRSVMGDPGLVLPPQPGQADFQHSLRRWLRDLGLQAPPAARLQEFLRQLASPSGAGSAQLEWGGRRLRHYRGSVYLLPEADAGIPSGVGLGPGETLVLGAQSRLTLEAAEGGLALAPGERLQLRTRRGGERCRPAGRGGSASLKKLLQEAGVPPWWRDCVPLLYLGEELVAVGDLWLCEGVRLAPPGRAGWLPRWVRGANDVNAAD